MARTFRNRGKLNSSSTGVAFCQSARYYVWIEFGSPSWDMGDSWTVLGPVDIMRYDSTRVLADESGELGSKLGPLLFCRRFCSE